MHGGHGKPLQIAGKTQHLDLQWGEARGRACFIAIVGLESPPCLIGMDIMRPLSVHIDVTNGTATPAQPDPQTIHLNAAQQQDAAPPAVSRALLFQTTDIPAETAQLVRCHNPWPSEDVYFCPEDALPAFVTGVPALSSGSEIWIAIHNHRPEPLRLHSGQNIGVLEVVTVADTPSSAPKPGPMRQPPIPEHLSPLQQQQLNGLFKEFSDVFSQGEDDLGCTLLLEHTIETHGPPLHQPYRRQNPAVWREEMAQVQQMLASDVIRPSNSPWASPLVMVKKKDGSLRFCVDFRQLNAATVKDAHPLPRIDDLPNALHGPCWFSTLDLKSGYWQVPIMERDKEKTAFRTSSGQLYECNQVPFGLCNAPATFSRLMDRVLSGLHWETCLFYLDDIIVFSSTWEEHLARLRQVFERLRHANLKLGAEKCTFAAKEVSYLGHRVTEEGLLPDPTLLTAIREILPPKTATEVRSFLGLAGYYRRYVKNFAAITGPLHALTRKDAVFHWSADCQDAFDRLKTHSLPVPSLPSLTLASLSGYIRMRQLQALAQYWHKSARAGSASSAALPSHSTRLRRLTPLPSWNVSPSFGPLPSFVHTLWLYHLRCTQTTTPCNGSKRCGQGRHSSTAGQQRWKSTTSQSSIGWGKPRPMSMASAGCLLTPHLQKMSSSTFASWKTRTKRENLRESSTLPRTLGGKRCGSSSASATTTKPAAAFASK